MTEPSNADIIRAVGRLEAGQESVVRDQERANASRRGIYEQLNSLSTATEVMAAAMAQNREATKALSAEVAPIKGEVTEARRDIAEVRTLIKTEVAPALRDVRAARKAIVLVAGLLSVGGVGVGGTLVFANEWARTSVQRWLGVQVVAASPLEASPVATLP